MKSMEDTMTSIAQETELDATPGAPQMQRPAPRARKKKKSRRTRLLQRRLLAFGVAAGVFLAIFSMGAAWRGGRGVKITEETIVAQLESLRALSTTSYHFTNVERFENINDFYGWDASEYAFFTLSYEGTVDAAVDPAGAKVEIKGKNISITLPEAKVTSDVIRQDSLAVYNSKQGKFERVELIDFSGFEGNQKTVVDAKATAGGLLFDASDKAKAAAKTLVEGLTAGSGKYDIAVK